MVAIAALVSLGALIIIFRAKLREPRLERAVLIVATSVALCCEASYHLIQYIQEDYYQYFLSHGYIVLTIVFFAAVRGFRIGFRSYLKAAGILFPITLAMRCFDLAFAFVGLSLGVMLLAYLPWLFGRALGRIRERKKGDARMLR